MPWRLDCEDAARAQRPSAKGDEESHLGETPLTEAKIHGFTVRPASCFRGIGTMLQRWAIARARGLGCHQVASYSCYDRAANYRIKLSLGFAAQPEVHGDNEQRVYFLMPLRGPMSEV